MLEPVTNTVVKQVKPEKVRSVISKETSDQVRFALENVVAHGSGRNAYIDGYRVGGKTGTAQKVKDGSYMVGNYILSFMGFLPADDPEVVLYVAIDNPKGVVQYGGTVAAPVARNVLLDCIDALNIEKRSGGYDKTYKYGDTKTAKIPDVVGMKVSEAMEHLGSFEVEFTGKGDTVLEQTPEAGTSVSEGSTVRLLVGNSN